MRITQHTARSSHAQLPSHNYQTFGIRSPLETHFRPATCEEFNCDAYRNGWGYRIETLEPALFYAATHSGKKYSIINKAEGESYLFFAAGQECFAAESHVVALGRPELYIAGRGDFRTFSDRKAYRYARPDQWVDDFATNLDRIRTATERG